MPRWPPLTGPELLRAQWHEDAEEGALQATVVGVTTEEVRTTTITRIEEEATIITTEATITTTGEATITTTIPTPITTEAEATTATIEEASTMFTSEVEATMSTSEEVTIVTTVEEASIVTTEAEAIIVTEEARSAEVLAASISSFCSISRPTLHHLLESATRRQHPLLPFKSPVRVTRSKVSFKFVEFTSRMLMMDTMSKLQIDDRLLLNFLSLSVEPRECFQII